MNKYTDKIVRLKNQGYTYKAISEQLNISIAYAREIYINYMYHLRIYEITGWNENIPIRIINSLRRQNLKTKSDVQKFIDNGGDLSTLRHIGKNSIKIIKDNL